MAKNKRNKNGQQTHTQDQAAAPMPISSKLRAALTAEQRNYEWALEWIHRCLDSHPMCHKLQAHAPLPERLIDLSGGNETQACLIATRALPQATEPIRYITLSYCWGQARDQSPAFVTTRSSLEDRQAGMSIAAMPLLFRDALELCRGLAVRYLWIDSLCIVQDDREEWHRESMRMEHIYRNALCCIVATHAPSPHVHLFLSELEDFKQSVRQEKNPDPDPATSEQVVWRAPVHADRAIAGGAVGKRAWCVQERYLSSRLLHFTTSGLFRECNHGIESTSTGLCLPPARSARHSTQVNAKDIAPNSDALLVRLYHDWGQLIHEYREKSLTRPSDALYAISGLAREIARATGGTYVAGHWMEKLALTLSWYVWPRGIATLPITARAPTWSWASLDTSIMWDMTPFQHNVTSAVTLVEHTTIGDPSASKYEEDPESNMLILRGWARTLTAKDLENMGTVEKPKGPKSRLTFAVQGDLLWDRDEEQSRRRDDTLVWFLLWTWGENPFKGQDSESLHKPGKMHRRGEMRAGGLLLRPEWHATLQKDIYRRIGYLSSEYQEDKLEEITICLI